MRRFLLVLFLLPNLLLSATFTEFYCDASAGNNLNSGSTTSGTALYTSAGGNWVQSTRVFTPTDSSTPASTVSVGMFASVYVTAGATDATFVGRITAVGVGVNGTITIDGTAKSGSAPANGTGTITLKVGGCWKGPSGADGFPFNNAALSNGAAMTDTAGNPTRINMKNNANYTFTSAQTSTFGAIIQGYTTTPGDGGRANIINQTTSVTWQFSTATTTLIDLDWSSTASSGSTDLVQLNVTSTMIRCSVHGSRASGVNISGGSVTYFYEDEFYSNNVANTASKAGVRSNAAQNNSLFYQCYFHDNTGSNTDAISTGSTTGQWTVISTIFDSNGSVGFRSGSSAGSNHLIINSDFYNNGSDAINLTSGGNFTHIYNCNFIKNTGKGINNTTTNFGYSYNNGYGAGTQANGSSDTLGDMVEIGKVTYASNVTPYNAPTTGDFRITLPAAMGAGRGNFVSTGNSKTGTVGYPDLGAAQHRDTCGGTGPCQTSSAAVH